MAEQSPHNTGNQALDDFMRITDAQLAHGQVETAPMADPYASDQYPPAPDAAPVETAPSDDDLHYDDDALEYGKVADANGHSHLEFTPLREPTTTNNPWFSPAAAETAPAEELGTSYNYTHDTVPADVPAPLPRRVPGQNLDAETAATHGTYHQPAAPSTPASFDAFAAGRVNTSDWAPEPVQPAPTYAGRATVAPRGFDDYPAPHATYPDFDDNFVPVPFDELGFGPADVLGDGDEFDENGHRTAAAWRKRDINQDWEDMMDNREHHGEASFDDTDKLTAADIDELEEMIEAAEAKDAAEAAALAAEEAESRAKGAHRHRKPRGMKITGPATLATWLIIKKAGLQERTGQTYERLPAGVRKWLRVIDLGAAVTAATVASRVMAPALSVLPITGHVSAAIHSVHHTLENFGIRQGGGQTGGKMAHASFETHTDGGADGTTNPADGTQVDTGNQEIYAARSQHNYDNDIRTALGLDPASGRASNVSDWARQSLEQSLHNAGVPDDEITKMTHDPKLMGQLEHAFYHQNPAVDHDARHFMNANDTYKTGNMNQLADKLAHDRADQLGIAIGDASTGDNTGNTDTQTDPGMPANHDNGNQNTGHTGFAAEADTRPQASGEYAGRHRANETLTGAALATLIATGAGVNGTVAGLGAVGRAQNAGVEAQPRNRRGTNAPSGPRDRSDPEEISSHRKNRRSRPVISRGRGVRRRA
jgi:hypothetical protein